MSTRAPQRNRLSTYLSESQVKTLLGKRDDNANKGDFGYIALVGGSRRYSGAIRLADMAAGAMRAGCGVCTVAAPDPICGVIASQVLESTIYPLSSDGDHLKFVEREFDELMLRYSVIAFGMGIGDSEDTKKALTYLLRNYDGILIIDADGLNALARIGKKTVKDHRCKVILTPHPKEFARVSKCEVDDVIKAPEESAKALANYIEGIVLLKGHTTTVTDGETTYLVNRGCVGMATAGSGDVLSGVLAALAACNKDNLLLATAGAAYINGLAGELAEKETGEISQIASDTVSKIPAAIKQIQEGEVKKKKNGHPMAVFLLIALLAFSGYVGVKYVIPLLAREASAESRVYEDYVVTMNAMKKDIYIDGVLVNNYQLSRPITDYNDRTYIPMTDELAGALGFSYSWNDETNVLTLTKKEASGEGAYIGISGWDLAPVTAMTVGGSKIVIDSGARKPETIKLEQDELISYANGLTVYIPLFRLIESESFDISASFDTTSGLVISTDKGKPAASYDLSNNLSYITGRAEYINQNRKELSFGEACLYEYYFRHAAVLEGLDEDFLLALAKQESSFDINDISATGAVGIMQVMRSTARSNGLDPEKLSDVHTNIDFGSDYIANFIAIYKGNYVKALSAYNQGAGKVSSGEYSTSYANAVLKKQSDIKARMTSRNFSNEFNTVIECTK